MKRMIVIGNGPIEGNRGQEIDQFDIVVRMSHFKTKGYESVCGTKTDIWSVSNLWPTEGKEHIPIVWCANPGGVYGLPFDETQKHYRNRCRCNSTHITDELYKGLGYTDPNKGKHPTLGMFTIAMAVEFAHFFYEMPITITGFTFYRGLKTDPKPFYHDTIRPPVGNAAEHNYDQEKVFVENLIQNGYLKWL